MNKAQLIVLGVAVAAGGGAFMIMNGEAPPPVSPVAAPVQQVDGVLVATQDLSYGAEVTGAEVKWIDWPKNAIPEGVLVKSADANAVEGLKGSYVRIPIASGEPVRRERLVKGVTAGLMSTMLPSGMRAVAIDVSASSTAGGFILPNDRVDVVRIYRDASATKDLGMEVMGSEIVLTNVRVLAMGQTIEKKGAEPVVVGSTATLELTPRQAERILLAQRTGQLALSLRPITDALAKADPGEGGSTNDVSLSVIKRGVKLDYRTR